MAGDRVACSVAPLVGLPRRPDLLARRRKNTVVGRPPNCSLGIPHLRVVIHTANPSSAGIISAMPMTVTHEPILF